MWCVFELKQLMICIILWKWFVINLYIYISLLIPETNTLNTILQQMHFTIIVSDDQENYTFHDNSRKWWGRKKRWNVNGLIFRVECCTIKVWMMRHIWIGTIYDCWGNDFWKFIHILEIKSTKVEFIKGKIKYKISVTSHIGLFSWNDGTMYLGWLLRGMVASNWALLTRICESTGSILPRIGRTCEATKTDRVWN